MYTIDDIVHHTGIPSNKVMEICNLLSTEGYLIYNKETSKYRLTKDRDLLSSVKKLWKQYKDDHTFEQMSGKIEDIIEFGKPLALSEKGPGEAVRDIGIPGLNIIFGSMEKTTKPGKKEVEAKKVPGLPRGHCLLIKGEPGTGKTTLGMQIALYLKKYRARFLTFEEDVNQLINDLHGYIQTDDNNDHAVGWKKSGVKEVTRSLIKIRTPNAWEDPDVVMDELISLFDKELPHLIVIDCISRFRDLGGDTKARQILRRLIRNLKCRRITSIFMAEDRGEENAFEEYEVDGIIKLQWAGDLLTLTVKKLRGMKAYKGPHSAALMTVEDLEQPQHRLISKERIKTDDDDKIGPYLTAGFNVFPDISVFKDIPGKDTEYNQKDKTMSTGTGGLDELLELPGEDKNGFKRGETILLVGSSGAGKTLLALNFMLDGYKKETPANEEKEHTLWINLEGAIGTLKFAVDGFEDPYKSEIMEMINSAQNNIEDTGKPGEKARFDFIDFPPINLDLNKIVYTLEAIHKSYTINSLVIDSITELERAKGSGQPAVKVFLAGLIQFLRERKITTLFVCRSDAFFRSIDKIEEQVSSLVDLIICIRNFDIHNQIHKGIYIQKARGRRHNSKIMRMNIDSKRKIEIEDSGWDLENLLAGDSSNIEMPRIFFKLFYENPAEESINKKIIADFDEQRYPGDDPKFTLVKKPSIYTEFWSFKGQFSAGHANTRVLSLADYVISAFRDNERLAEVDKYIKSEVLQNIEMESEKQLERLYLQKIEEKRSYIAFEPYIGANKKRIIDAIPCYRDYGVMLFKDLYTEFGISQNTLLKEENNFLTFLQKNSEKVKWKGVTDNGTEAKDDNIWENGEYKYRWEEILKLIQEINMKKNDAAHEIIPFAFPPLDNRAEFVAFFMELLWSHGGDIYKSDIKIRAEESDDEEAFKKKICESIFKEFMSYCLLDQKGRNEGQIISALNAKKLPKDTNVVSILNDFEKKFDNYGLKSKDIDIEKFKEWMVKKLGKMKAPENLKEESVLMLYDKPFEDTIKLMLRMVYRSGIYNPIEGEFRHRAILSRKWYSRIFLLKIEKCNQCSKPDKKKCVHYTDSDKKKCRENRQWEEEKYNLLPLPLAKIEIDKKGVYKYYRSVTCLTYWSLVMLNNALSPEIGGNFIESMNAPDYYEERLINKLGMPVMNIELKKKRLRDFDPESYAILDRALENSIKNVETKNKSGNEYTYVYYEFIDALKDLESQVTFFKDHEGDFHKRLFFSKGRQTRTAFYQLEQALHYQLRQLFIEDSASRDERLYNGENIVEEIKKICKEERKKQESGEPIDENKWNGCLEKIAHEFRMHVIFELLTYFYHENLRGADETRYKEKENAADKS